jgi:hypothetical protein
MGGGSIGESGRLVKLSLVFSAALTLISMIVAIVKVEHALFDTPTDEQSSDYKLGVSQDVAHAPLEVSQAVEHAPIGSLGPSNTIRSKFRYYDSLFYTTLQYGANAESVIEVGCASDPFIKYLDWVDKRTCVAPYFVDYANNKMESNITKVERITADFMKYELPDNKKYDLLLCNQVLEHVPQPSLFMKKLISSAKTSIISVPFNWGDCGKGCNHLTDKITYEKILKWSAPHKPIHSGIVTEKVNYEFNRRIILVYTESDEIVEVKVGNGSGEILKENSTTLTKDETAASPDKDIGRDVVSIV